MRSASALLLSDRECIQRTAVALRCRRERCSRSSFLPGRDWPEQHLDGTQVGTGFEQMRGKAVAQRYEGGCAVRKTGAFGAC